MASAVASGLRFLDGIVEADGAWPSFGVHERGRPAVPERTPFAAALGILALETCDRPRARALCARSRTFLHSRIEYPGVWRYLPALAPDLDDTAMCSLAAGSHLWVLAGRNVGPVLSCRDGTGRFLTWMYSGDEAASAPNAVDSVVNANVLAYLGDRPETRAAQTWLERLVEERRESGTAPYYLTTMDLYAAMARACHLAPPVFAGLRTTLASRIVEQLESRDEPVDVLRMAQGMTALDQLGVSGGDEAVRRTLEGLLEAQRADGGWPDCSLMKGRPGTAVGLFTSEALTAACCVGAMARAMRT